MLRYAVEMFVHKNSSPRESFVILANTSSHTQTNLLDNFPKIIFFEYFLAWEMLIEFFSKEFRENYQNKGL